MNDQPDLPDYERIADALDPCHPSELHGQLCGMLCMDDALDDERWLSVLSADAADVVDAASLVELYRATVSQIGDDDFGMTLLLPDDEMNMSVRAESLSFWCQGLLTGLGIGGLPAQSELSGDSREFLEDVSQIARIGLDGDRSDEEDEIAYSEIVEYLRMGLLLLNRELSGLRAERASYQRLH